MSISWHVFAYETPGGIKIPIRYYRQSFRTHRLEFYDADRGIWRKSMNAFDFPQKCDKCTLVAKYVRFRK